MTNRADSSGYYRFGDCDIPVIFRVEDAREIQLMTYVLEEEIVPKELPAGESLSCKWHQHAYWNPEGEGDDRFNLMMGSHQVPPGRYQFRFRYAFEEDHVYSSVVSTVVKSPVFTIE